MQRTSYLITVSASLVEGIALARSEGAEASGGVPVPAGEAPLAERLQGALESLLGGLDWAPGPAVLVLPTGEITFRRLEFPVRDARKIRQTLPFELEEEVLEPLEHYAYDFEMRPRGEQDTHVPVYMVHRDLLQPLVDTCERHGLPVTRSLFGARALLAAEPPPAGRHVQVYLGPDDASVLLTQEGHVRMVESLPLRLEAFAPLVGAHRGRPHALLAALARPEEADATQEQAGPHTADDAAGDAAGDAAAARRELERAPEAISRFLRVHVADQDFTLSVHGLFAPLLDWQPGADKVTLRAAPAGGSGALGRPLAGIGAELADAARTLTAARGVNFTRRAAVWRTQVRELRWPLVATALLVVLLAGLLGGEVYYRSAHLRYRLDSLQQRVQAALGVSGGEDPAAARTALERLQSQLDQLRQAQRTTARFQDYHYDTLRLFRELSRVLSQVPQFTVDSVSFNTERFTMSGTTASYADSEAVKRRLMALPRFEDGEASVTHSRSGETIRYRLSIER